MYFRVIVKENSVWMWLTRSSERQVYIFGRKFERKRVDKVWKKKGSTSFFKNDNEKKSNKCGKEGIKM